MTGLLALTKIQGLILAAGGVVFIAIAGATIALRGRTKAESPDIPPAMRPGPSDPDLETPLLNKLQGWGVLLVVFFVIWIPLTWLREPSENLAQERALKTDAIERGKDGVQLFSEENQTGIGCVRCHGPELRGQVIQVGETTYPSANLTTVCSRLTVDEIRATIEQGRAVTLGGEEILVMPSWSIRYAGALDDQQISDIIQYLIEINEKTVPFEQNKCLNPEAASPASEQSP